MESILGELTGILNQPTAAGMLASISLVIMLVNLAKDQFGVHDNGVWIANLLSSAVVAALKYFGPFAFTVFNVGDWIGMTLFYTVGAAMVWAGVIKLPLHKIRGTEPKMVREAKVVGKPLGVRKMKKLEPKEKD